MSFGLSRSGLTGGLAEPANLAIFGEIGTAKKNNWMLPTSKFWHCRAAVKEPRPAIFGLPISKLSFLEFPIIPTAFLRLFD
ncbi:hypothetical protein [Nisaea sediminum]|uniref:hypothetical protein n=1 Tax=Nisaea sediminum TaxID=2775867 RepID=UPI0018671AEF|nr:hypothetical protein [Nisaea sediminum]